MILSGISGTYIMIIVVLGIGTTMLSQYISHRDDAPLEELTEHVIESQTGLELDLTPHSEE